MLGRHIRATADGGWQYEADQRHAQLIIDGLHMRHANGVKTPGEDARKCDLEEENGAPLVGPETTLFRALAARANYLAQGRSDIQFAAKEICRGMAAPTQAHIRMLKRLARYLLSVPRVVWDFAPVAAPCMHLDAYSDADWAGCRVTGKSASGGTLMIGPK